MKKITLHTVIAKQAFTLMELMIVIVIIGILSAVGMVMFGGQTEKAKIVATKANHKQAVKYVSSEIMKCEIGESAIFEGTLNCSDLSVSKAIKALVPVLQKTFKNAHQPNHSDIVYSTGIYLSGGTCKNNNQNLGIICFYGDSNPKILNVEVCYKTDCKDPDNILLSKINFE